MLHRIGFHEIASTLSHLHRRQQRRRLASAMAVLLGLALLAWLEHAADRHAHQQSILCVTALTAHEQKGEPNVRTREAEPSLAGGPRRFPPGDPGRRRWHH